MRYSHSLSKAFRKCRSLAMPDVESLDPLAERLDEMNRDHDLRYPSGYTLSLPTPKESLTIAYAFKDTIKPVLNIEYWRAALRLASGTCNHRGKQIQ